MVPILHALPREWKEAISVHDGSLENLLIQDHHLIKKNQILCITKLNSIELCKIQIIIKYKKPTSQSYFENIFNNSNLDWKAIYLLPRIATVDTTIRVFQYKLLNNVLFLNITVCRFGISQDSLLLLLLLPCAILGITNSESENFIVINHLLLMFEYYIFKSRCNKHLSFLQLKTDVIKVKTLEEDLSNGDNNKSKKYRKKWQKISDIFV